MRTIEIKEEVKIDQGDQIIILEKGDKVRVVEALVNGWSFYSNMNQTTKEVGDEFVTIFRYGQDSYKVVWGHLSESAANPNRVGSEYPNKSGAEVLDIVNSFGIFGGLNQDILNSLSIGV